MKLYQNIQSVYSSHPRCAKLVVLLAEGAAIWGAMFALHLVH